jgi:hypothetical protein
MSDVTLLRKLTEKSILKFGQYADVPIWNLLELKKYSYLRWVYFNSSNITFFENILLEIGITEEYFIEKPGVNPEFHEKLTEIKRENTSWKTQKHLDKVSKYRIKNKNNQIKNLDRINYSKSNLARKNQGH